MLRMLAALSLLACLSAPFLFFWGYVGEGSFRTMFAVTSLLWFVFAGMAMMRRSAR